jgi:hypothetical protein
MSEFQVKVTGQEMAARRSQIAQLRSIKQIEQMKMRAVMEE